MDFYERSRPTGVEIDTENKQISSKNGDQTFVEVSLGEEEVPSSSCVGITDQADPYRFPKRANVVIAVSIVSLGFLSIGTVLEWPAVASKGIKDASLGRDDEISWIASLALLGAMISTPINGYLMARIGQKTAMLITVLPSVLGWMLIIYAENVTMFYVGRTITGFSAGTFTVSGPAYVLEISDDRIRGIMGTTLIFVLCIGTELTYIVGAVLNWRELSIICAIIPVLFFIGMIFMPESPRFLVQKEKVEDARRALKWLRGTSTDKHIEEEFLNIQNSISSMKDQSTKFIDLLSPSTIKPIGISIALMFFGQLSGVNGIFLYTVAVFEEAGTSMDGEIASIIIGACQLLTMILVPFILIEILGRKALMVVSELVMVVGFTAFGTFYYLKKYEHVEPGSINWLPLTSMITVIIGYNIGMGSVPWVVFSEISPPNVRASAFSLITISYWGFAFTGGITFEPLQEVLGHHGLYWLCSGVCAFGLVFVLIFVPETKGKSFEEIHALFATKKSISSYNSSSLCGPATTAFEAGNNIAFAKKGIDNLAFLSRRSSSRNSGVNL